MSYFAVWVSVAPLTASKDAGIHDTKRVAKALSMPDLRAEDRMRTSVEKFSLFEKHVKSAIANSLAPYKENLINPKNLEFVDTEQENKAIYETETLLVIRMPDGALCHQHDLRFSNRYVLHGGNVYPMKSCKNFLETQLTDRVPDGKPLAGFEVIENYPLKNFYPTFQQFMEDYICESFNEEKNAYGHYNYPDAKWDSWKIGGHWQKVFLVPNDRLVEYGEIAIFGKQESCAPKGYHWVVGARKADIQWEIMRKASHEKAYLPLIPHAFIDANGWQEAGEMGWLGISSNKKDQMLWHEQVEMFINSIPSDYYLVSVDCHI